jgi:hypothetical protein
MKITVQFTDSCSHQDAVRDLLREAVADAGVEVEIEESSVRTDEEAQRAKVLGSPTIRVEGLDVEYAEREPDETSNGCRYYNTPAGWKPFPEKGMIIRAIERARGSAQPR